MESIWIENQIGILEQALKTHKAGCENTQRQLEWYRKLKKHVAKPAKM
jgi:hypothetical protein